VKFTSSIPSRPLARPPSVQLIQARPDDPMTAFLVEHRIQSRGTPRELIPLPRPRPKRLNRRFMWPPAWQEEMQRAAQTSLPWVRPVFTQPGWTAGPDGGHEPKPHRPITCHYSLASSGTGRGGLSRHSPSASPGSASQGARPRHAVDARPLCLLQLSPSNPSSNSSPGAASRARMAGLPAHRSLACRALGWQVAACSRASE
jgi:hypothetical protein